MHVRLARQGARRRLIRVLMLAALCAVAACGRSQSDVAITISLDPPAPVTGAATMARIRLHAEDGRPLAAANVRVDAHMTHPGMAPVLPDVVRVAEGEYETHLEFSMAGNWLLVVTGELPDGQRFVRESAVVVITPESR